MFQMSRKTFFSTKYSSYWDFPSISEIIRIFPEYLWHGSPGRPEQIVAFLSRSKSDGESRKIVRSFKLEHYWRLKAQRRGKPFSFDLCQPRYFLRQPSISMLLCSGVNTFHLRVSGRRGEVDLKRRLCFGFSYLPKTILLFLLCPFARLFLRRWWWGYEVDSCN